MKATILLLIASLCTVHLTFGQAPGPKPVLPDAKPAAKPAAPKKSRPIPFHGPIAAVNKTTKTVTVGKNKLRVFYITPETKINRDKQPTSIEQLVQGTQVGGSYREDPSGKLELVTINVKGSEGVADKKTKN